MKIFIHCMPGYSAFALELIKYSRTAGTPFDWSIVLYSNGEGLQDKLIDQVGAENVLDLQKHLNVLMEKKDVNLDEMKDFPASIFECVSTSKIHFGHISLQHEDRAYQLKLIAGTYSIYKDFLVKNRPDHVFFPLVEQYDAMILYHLCRELNITPIVYDHARNLNKAFFTDSLYQALPSYAFSIKPSDAVRQEAKEFIMAFREKPSPASGIQCKPNEDVIIDTSYLKKSLFHKAIQFIKIRFLVPVEPHVVDRFTLVHNLKIHFIGYIEKRRIKHYPKRLRKLPFDIRSIAQLPAKFVYYPLQYTPESSINTPAPFFADQLRSIDLILNALPADYYLVIRDHKYKIYELDNKHKAFYSELKQKAGVLLAEPTIPNIDILKCASLTISVTGTSCLEAFLLGKPSLHLGRVYFSDWISRFDCFSTFKKEVHSAIESKEVPLEKIVDLVARVFTIGNDFYLSSIGGGPFSKDYLVMNKKNFRVFLEALKKHIDNMK